MCGASYSANPEDMFSGFQGKVRPGWKCLLKRLELFATAAEIIKNVL
jgi:hypothetical protein